MKYIAIIILFLIFYCPSFAQDRPRIVVGIVVDQMRMEYLYRFEKKFSDGGFKRLINDGFLLKNMNYNYVPTYTGPGHASIYTGSTPSIHGIIGNSWYDKKLGKNVNCVEDGKFKAIGNDGANGDVSPMRLLPTTVTDELKLSFQRHSKVVGISMKDRAAVLPAGHLADGAYWYDQSSGKFITSTFYKSEPPSWLNKFNDRKLAENFLTKEWSTLLPINQYVESTADDKPYESSLKGKGTKPVFPYRLKDMGAENQKYNSVLSTPFGNEMLLELAKVTIEGEGLGEDDIPDFLSVSFSSPDIVGHAMGPRSIELEDVYLRLDQNVAELLKFLDNKFGDRYSVFLTADHGVADVPDYSLENNIPAGIISEPEIEANLKQYLKEYYPDKSIIDKVINNQIYLNHDAFVGDPRKTGLELIVVSELISKYLLAVDGIGNVVSQATLRNADYGVLGWKGDVYRGYNWKRSGDIAFILEPQWIESSYHTGTTHGSGYRYDTNVPAIFFGFGFNKGSSVAHHLITDIAPTISVLLKINFPSGCTGQPLSEVLKN